MRRDWTLWSRFAQSSLPEKRLRNGASAPVIGASVYTRDVERGERIAADLLDAGNCFVNGMVKSDPRLPFGGTKQSGYSRELSSLGILEFTNAKTVWVK